MITWVLWYNNVMEKRNNVYFLVWNLLKKLLNNQITIRTTAMRLSPSVLHILLWRSYYNIQHVIILNSNLVHHYSNIKYWSHTLFPLHMSGRICGPKTNTKFAAREVLGMRDTNNTLRYAIADSTSTKSGPCEQVYYKKKVLRGSPKRGTSPTKGLLVTPLPHLWILEGLHCFFGCHAGNTPTTLLFYPNTFRVDAHACLSTKFGRFVSFFGLPW